MEDDAKIDALAEILMHEADTLNANERLTTTELQKYFGQEGPFKPVRRCLARQAAQAFKMGCAVS